MQILFAFLLFAAFAVAQALIGGAKMLYSIPAYALVALAALLALIPALRKPSKPRVGCVAATLCFIGYILWRGWNSPVEYLARTDLMIALGALAVYLLTAYFFVEAKARLLLCGLLFAPAFAHVLSGLVQFKEGTNFMLIPWFIRYQYESRASGFYICPNHLAGFLELLGVMGLSIAIWSRWRAWARLLAFYAALACYAGVAITGSRGGYLSCAFSLGVFAVLTLMAIRAISPERFLRLLPVVVVGVGLLIGGALYLMLKSDFLKYRVEQFSAIGDSNDVRMLLWRAAIQQFQLNPVTGTGAGTYLYYGRQFRSDKIQHDPIYVHNDYLHLLAEYGVIAAVLLVPFVIMHLAGGVAGTGAIVRKRMIRDGLPGSNSLALVIGATSGISAYLVHSVVDFNLHIPANALFMGFLFGILANPGGAGAADGKLSRRITKGSGWLVPATGLALAWFALPKWVGEYYAERARVCSRDAMWPEAVEHATIGLGVDPDNPDLYWYQGESLRTIGFWSGMDYPFDAGTYTKRAVAAFEKGLSIFPQDVRMLYRMGCALDHIYRFPEAETYYKRALAADPNFSASHAFFGLHLHQQSRYDEAEQHYRKALSLDGNNQIAKAGLEDVLATLKKRQEKPGRYPIGFE
jgi:O-antigen ligase